MFSANANDIKSADPCNDTGNPYASTFAHDDLNLTIESDGAEPRMWQTVERIHFWCIGLAISLVLLTAAIFLPLAYVLSQPGDQIIADTLLLGSIVCGLTVGVFLLVRYIRAQSQALASRKLADLAIACEAQFDCWRIGALSVLVEVGVLFGLGFFA